MFLIPFMLVSSIFLYLSNVILNQASGVLRTKLPDHMKFKFLIKNK